MKIKNKTSNFVDIRLSSDEYKAFVDAMDDDLNTSKALAVLFDLTNKANKDVNYAYTLLYKPVPVRSFQFLPQLRNDL